ncbi:MAG: RDD family protein [Pseudonocardiaceae bacterium]
MDGRAETAFAVWSSGYRQGRTGQSIGRWVTKTKLVKIETGEPIGFGRALLRLICAKYGRKYLWLDLQALAMSLLRPCQPSE